MSDNVRDKLKPLITGPCDSYFRFLAPARLKRLFLLDCERRGTTYSEEFRAYAVGRVIDWASKDPASFQNLTSKLK